MLKKSTIGVEKTTIMVVFRIDSHFFRLMFLGLFQSLNGSLLWIFENKELRQMGQQTAEKSKTVLNGVDVDAVAGLIDTIKEQPDLAESKFRVSNEWIDGGHNRTTITGFYGAGQEISHTKPFVLDADEPPVLAGHDKGANPVEHLLNALAA